MKRSPRARGLSEPWLVFERAWHRSEPHDVVGSAARICTGASGAARRGRSDSEAISLLLALGAMARVRSDVLWHAGA